MTDRRKVGTEKWRRSEDEPIRVRKERVIGVVSVSLYVHLPESSFLLQRLYSLENTHLERTKKKIRGVLMTKSFFSVKQACYYRFNFLQVLDATMVDVPTEESDEGRVGSKVGR